MKKHYKTVQDSNGKDEKELVTILDNPANKFEYIFKLANNNEISSSGLYFTGQKTGQEIRFRAMVDENRYFEQVYTLSKDNYSLDYKINAQGLSSVLSPKSTSIKLYWENHLNKNEKGQQFEQNYSTVYFKEVDESSDYCKCVSDDSKELKDKGIEWISHTNQFFNTSL
ncbi:MAG: YidC/Oxa1 family insertase periplasmic-domain containing protein [Saprospiraceae bacterium]|nr:YidC/Oxa1 family insertase periplasmic-domain containing protein [Saprospiraceae bacterium]